ncbi:MAG TPA: DUF1013 domain-containing protein [Alphaproteobacteria bacterium]|nr:DUF1013 domain-containing protein [Alphaproteobacteria bacterium]
MPKATAMWLINNTALTFEQIAEFCTLHQLEVKAMADETHPERIIPLDPVMTGQLTRQEIEAAEKDPRKRLVQSKSRYEVPESKSKGKRRQRYVPVSRRQDRPDAIYWILRNHPEMPDSEIGKLVGTTKSTIESIRNKTHWNASNIKAVDPVTLGLCTQLDLDLAVERAQALKVKTSGGDGAKLKPAQDSVKAAQEAASNPSMKYDPASVYSSMQKFKGRT